MLAAGPELRITGAAAQTRMVSVARIRLVSPKSTRLFKGIICDDISENGPYESIAFRCDRGDRGGGDSPVQNADERLQSHATKARNRTRAPGRRCGQSPNKVVDQLCIIEIILMQ
jgi:hypothetical protein